MDRRQQKGQARKLDFDMHELRRQRRAKGWTQGQLAKALGTSVAAISEWERGLREPRAKRIPKIAKLFKMDSLELVKSMEVTPTKTVAA